MKDFFISYNKADKKWAEWIAWQLEETGYAVEIQAWDSQFGENFIKWMNEASKNCERTIAVLSKAYFTGRFSEDEWTAAFHKNKLLPIRIEAIEIEGLLGPIAYIDLVDLNEIDAREKLLQDVKLERKKPQTAPVFPGSATHTVIMPKRFPGALPPIWNVPHLRNPNFTGRDKILNKLHQALSSGQPAALTQALTGLGGIGKTQIALEYAHRYAADYDIIWWLRAEEPETLAADYIAFAQAAGLPERELTEQELIIAAVRRYLEQRSGWLLIFDNAVHPDDLQEYIPRGPAKRLLITSRHRDWESLGRSISVQTWPREEAVDFLLKRTQQTDHNDANALAKALGDLPLALEQAAAYIKASSLSFAKYLSLFTARRTELWQEERPPAAYHQDTVATTWSLALEEVSATAPVGVQIMNLCAYLAPDNIPRSLLDQIGEYLPKDLAELFVDSLAVNRGIQALNHYSLIDSDPNTLSIHSLVQAVVQDRLEGEEQKTWITTAVQLIEASFPGNGDYDPQNWPRCMELLSHALVIVDNTEQHQTALQAVASLLNKVALYLHGRATYSDAESLYRRALEIREAHLGMEHPDVAQSLNNLAGLLQAQGKYSEAEPLYHRALEIVEAQLGVEHLDVATNLNNLAGLLKDQGKYSEAEPLFRRALEIVEVQLGAEHRSVASSLNNLGDLLREQGKYSEAEPLFRRALEIVEARLGAEHPYMAISLNNLAELLREQGKYSEAEPLFQRALEINKARLGAEHPSVAGILNNLAILLQEQGKYSEAKPLYRRALEIVEAQLGTEHPSVAISLNNLAELLRDQGNYSEAEPLYRRALEINKSQLGTGHPSVASSINNLALLLQAQGNYSEAESLYRQALEIKEMQLGANHPKVATNLDNLAGLLMDQGKYGEAESLLQRALEIREAQLGAEHPSVANSLNNLAGLLMDQGKYSEAEPLLRRALEIYEAQLGAVHPYVATSLNNLAGLLKDQGKYSKAGHLYRRALEIREVKLGAEHPSVATSLNNLAELLREQGKYNDIEPLYRRALEICEKVLGKNHPNTNTVRENLEKFLVEIKSTRNK